MQTRQREIRNHPRNHIHIQWTGTKDKDKTLKNPLQQQPHHDPNRNTNSRHLQHSNGVASSRTAS